MVIWSILAAAVAYHFVSDVVLQYFFVHGIIVSEFLGIGKFFLYRDRVMLSAHISLVPTDSTHTCIINLLVSFGASEDFFTYRALLIRLIVL